MKKLILPFPAFVSLFLILIFIFSCNDSINESITNVKSDDAFSLEKKNKNDSLDIDLGIEAYPCNIRVEVTWKFHHYSPDNGKILGIWPKTASQSLWEEYKDTWGFSQIIVSNHDQRLIANSANFSNNDIMLRLSHNSSQYQSLILNDDVKFYYIDEPLERQTYSVNELIGVSNFIAVNRPNSDLYMGSYAYTPYLYPSWDYRNIINSTSNTYIQCDWYDNEFNTYDQRNVWEGFKYILGNRNPSNWIHVSRDYGEFDQLLGKANNLGLTCIWLFIGSDGNPNNVPDFCYYAWQKGFLKKYIQKVTKYLRCIEGDCAICSEGGTWIEYNRIYGEIIEVE